MRLEALILENFRGYKDKIRINLSDLTAFVGKNDVGKSTILEALEIFFNNKGAIKFEKADMCVYGAKKDVRIGCIFSNYPDPLVLDVKASTNLKEEYLLNKEGNLEIYKCFDCDGLKIKEKIIAIAMHPTVADADDLLLLKNEELKQRLEALQIDKKKAKLSNNPSIRKAIWENFSDLKLSEKEIFLDGDSGKKAVEGDVKKIWGKLSEEMPVFALFQSDRASRDDDDEIQDPMKVAVSEAIKLVQPQIEQIKNVVQKSALDVANRTLGKLQEMNPKLASKLTPDFKTEPKWDSLFKLTLRDQDQIPINKRGSGVRRLILINFFRAEAERRQKEENAPGIIYAIEEPETSQHPHNQRMLVEAFKELSGQSGCQVLLTTHVPGFAGLLPVGSLRHVELEGSNINIKYGGEDKEDILKEITKDLGVLPELNEIKVLVCVEGPSDVLFLKIISEMLHRQNATLPDLKNDTHIATFPLGGSTLKEWVNCNYLRGLGLSEIHIYDKDKPEYQQYCDKVNARGDGSWATLTGKRSIENYLCPTLINAEYGINIGFNDDDDVADIVAEAVHAASESPNSWGSLKDPNKKDKKTRCKKRMCEVIVKNMNYTLLLQRDPNKDIEK